MLPRERLIEIAVAVAGVGTMVLLLYLVGRAYGTVENGQPQLDQAGGEVIVFTIVAFVLLMAVAGLVLLKTVTEVEADDAGDDPADDVTNG